MLTVNFLMEIKRQQFCYLVSKPKNTVSPPPPDSPWRAITKGHFHDSPATQSEVVTVHQNIKKTNDDWAVKAVSGQPCSKKKEQSLRHRMGPTRSCSPPKKRASMGNQKPVAECSTNV